MMNGNRILLLAAVTASLLMATAGSLEAGNCTWIVPPPNVNFGTHSVFSPTALDSSTSLQVRCTPHTNAVLTFSRGTSSASYTPRTMGNATERVNYNLFTDSAMTSIWGDGTGGSTVYSLINATPREKIFDEFIYSRVFPGPDVRAGIYTDTITATLAWDSSSSDSRTFTVSVEVLSECMVETFSLAFGSYEPAVAHRATPLDATGQVRVYCTKGTSGMISLSPGASSAGGFRRMRGLTDFLNYDIFRDSGYAGVWSTTSVNSGVSTSKLIPLGGGFTAFGRIPPGQNVAIGSYADTVVATVNY